jgi:antitoxin (DNA-binding transcriptional repressor) of toxin-antitoxin stability system
MKNDVAGGEPTTMPTVTIEEAQNRLTELIHRLTPGDEVVITENDQPGARLVATAPPQRKPRKLGTLRGTVLYMAPDFDAPLDELKEYME